ncbi:MULTISPECIES: EpsG family protein [Pectobacterium]|mgnify:CR=1 FL=1|uniref:EpsG family protein n=1 Tax=Pectobacterium TaxID=122277 RepID=UPI0015DDBF66|nr:EpsG family protein [Pectobacterium brasiliense]MBA0198317.1 EpsG family protein [Pectobacterium brasiliense]MBN3069737.1 EpsG family protein [Pectobacterium brasiliense]MBN3095847.1 EpsG family protein [Pectobacterium brasiliense]MBN3246787.1 EpsG family protein [Pectobacterium brasiliense]
MSKAIFFLKCTIISLLAAIPMAMQGVFEDSEVYYQQALNIWVSGLDDALSTLVIQTGKLEWGFQFILFLEKPFVDGEFSFILLNVILVNLCVIHMASMIANKSGGRLSIYAIVCIVSSYFVLSNTLYVWRTIYAIYFLFLGINARTIILSVILILLSISFHYTAAIFYFLYLAAKRMPDNKVFIFILAFLASLILFLCISYIPFLDGFVSAGGTDVFLSSEGALWKRLIIGVFLLVCLMCYSPENDNNDLYKFSVILCSMSIFLSFNYQLSWRIFVPAALFGICLLINHRKNALLNLLLFCSCLPSIRIFYLLSTGEFK